MKWSDPKIIEVMEVIMDNQGMQYDPTESFKLRSKVEREILQEIDSISPSSVKPVLRL